MPGSPAQAGDILTGGPHPRKLPLFYLITVSLDLYLQPTSLSSKMPHTSISVVLVLDPLMQPFSLPFPPARLNRAISSKLADLPIHIVPYPNYEQLQTSLLHLSIHTVSSTHFTPPCNYPAFGPTTTLLIFSGATSSYNIDLTSSIPTARTVFSTSSGCRISSSIKARIPRNCATPIESSS